MQKWGNPSRCNHFSEHEGTLVQKCLSFYPWYFTVCTCEISVCFRTRTGKRSGQNNHGNRLCPPLTLNLLFFASSKSKAKLLSFSCLFDCYVCFIGKLFALEQKYSDKLEKNFSVQVQPIKLESKSFSWDTSSTISTWSYYATFLCWKWWLVLELGCWSFSQICTLVN